MIAPTSRPYVLWLETLPSGDEAKLFVYPQRYQANVVLHWNGTFHSVQTLASRDLAEQRGGKCTTSCSRPTNSIPD